MLKAKSVGWPYQKDDIIETLSSTFCLPGFNFYIDPTYKWTRLSSSLTLARMECEQHTQNTNKSSSWAVTFLVGLSLNRNEQQVQFFIL